MLTPPPIINSHSLSALGYTAFTSTNDEEGALSDSGHSQSSSQRSTSVPSLPDPSHFPEPKPNRRQPRLQPVNSTLTLSSGDSSSTSTRSSAYTGSAKSGDYGHVHVALGDDESGKGVGVGITTDDVVQLLSKDAGVPQPTAGRTPVDQTRWSDFYRDGVRSRSSSLANSSKPDSMHEKVISPQLRSSPSFDLAWQQPDERDEAGLGSDEDTDEDPSFDDDEDEEDTAEEPTSAVVMAEEGRGVIVRGDDTPIVRLHVSPGAPHLRPHLTYALTRMRWIRNDALAHWFLSDAQFCSHFPRIYSSSNLFFPTGSRHFSQLSQRTPTLTFSVH